MSAPLPRVVTLRAIAQKLGVDHSTVSLALRDSPKISLARRQQIQKTAREMGYRLNPFAAALGQQRHHASATTIGAEIAWINHWEHSDRLRSHREFNLYWEGARQTAERAGYRLEEFLCNAQMPARRLQGVLAARNMRGVLIPPADRNALDLTAFDWANLTAVRFGYSIKNPLVHVVTSDQLSNSLLAFENMRRLGYDRIGYVTSMVVRTRFKAGFLMAQSELPTALCVPMLVLATGEHDTNDLRQLDSWLQAHQPSAILTDIGGMKTMLESLGVHVPRDIGLAALSILDGNADAGIYQNSKEIGKAAVELLISQLNHHHVGIPAVCREVLIEGSWVDGLTLPSKTNFSGKPAEILAPVSPTSTTT